MEASSGNTGIGLAMVWYVREVGDINDDDEDEMVQSIYASE